MNHGQRMLLACVRSPSSALQRTLTDRRSSGGQPFTAKAGALFGLTGVALYFYFQNEKKKVAERKVAETAHVKVGKPKIGGPFVLTDQDGKDFSDKDLLGKWSLVYFGFTNCPDICPEELDKMGEVVKGISAAKSIDILPVFITCDPARDNVEAVKAYVKALNLTYLHIPSSFLPDFHPSLVGLTGTFADIKACCKAYRVYFSTPPNALATDDYLVDHSIFFYLMDPNGKFVDAFGRSMGPKDVAEKIGTYLDEWERDGDVVGKEAAPETSQGGVGEVSQVEHRPPPLSLSLSHIAALPYRFTALLFHRLASALRKDSPSPPHPTQPSVSASGDTAASDMTTSPVARAPDAPLALPLAIPDRQCDWFTPMQHRLKRPIRVLSLDGGGYRGLSSLLALQQVLNFAREDLNEPARRPCEVFDLIVGTSTGGLIALMLGRLGLSITEAIDLYISMGPRIFGKPGYGHLVAQGRFDVRGLEDCMVEVAGRETKLMQPTNADAGPSCYTAVTTSFSSLSGPQPVLLRSYPSIEGMSPAGHEWTFVEAARATSAAPTYFEPIVVEDLLFEDAGASGNNNPAEIALQEAQRLSKTDAWKGRAEVGPIMLLSVGTGVASLIRKGARTADDLANDPKLFSTLRTAFTAPGETKRRALGLVQHFIKIATDSSAVANRVFYAYNEGDHYYRLDVPADLGNIDLADYGQRGIIEALTNTYLTSNETRARVKRCAGMLKETEEQRLARETLVQEVSLN
ncbi:protein SCO1, partial [Phenoliferia sp. Uapishka_3]